MTPLVLSVLAPLLVACGAPGTVPESSTRASDKVESRALIVALRYEPTDLSPKTAAQGGGDALDDLFNATLTAKDHQGAAQPVLLEALPALHTDSWRVFADGRMETIYRLRPGLMWHDGQPLLAEDFAFAWRLYSDPALGVFTAKPQDQMESVTAVDARTFVVRWQFPYPDADILGKEFPPLPQHILGPPFSSYVQDASYRDALVNHPYWTTEYVGLGPYRLEQWESGIAFRGVAFDRYVRGAPRIGRIVAQFFADENTVLANILSETVHFAANLTLRFEHGVTLEREWSGTSRGTVVFSTGGTPHHALVQFRPEYQKTSALLDLRVRKALAHAIDKQALLNGLFDGQGIIAQTSAPTEEPYYPEVERIVTKYAYDPRRTEELMNEAGLRKGGSGFYASAAGERFRPDFTTLTGTVFERHHAIMLDTWVRVGIDVNPSILPAVQVRNSEVRSTFSGMMQAGGTDFGTGFGFSTSAIGTPSSGWRGPNRGGWSSPQYDRLWEAYNTTLGRPEREGILIQMFKMISDELPAFPLYHNPSVRAHVSGLTGPRAESNYWWNVHEWEWRLISGNVSDLLGVVVEHEGGHGRGSADQPREVAARVLP